MITLFTRRGSTPTQDSITKLESKRVSALADFDKARAAYATAALAVEDGAEGADSQLAQARKAVAKAEERYSEVAAASEAAKARHAAALEAAERAERARAWNEAGEAAKQRLDAIRAFSATAERLASDYQRYLATSSALQVAMPSSARPDMAEALLRADHVVNSARLALRKAGIPWAHSFPEDPINLPDFAEQATMETAALIALRPEGV